jgi:hypothetical protein
MIKNYFLTAWRSLWKNRTFSLLNISGLAIGISCATLIFLWVEDERNYNNYFTNQDHLYQVMDNQQFDGKTYTFFPCQGHLQKPPKQKFLVLKILPEQTGAAVYFSMMAKRECWQMASMQMQPFLLCLTISLSKATRLQLLVNYILW